MPRTTTWLTLTIPLCLGSLFAGCSGSSSRRTVVVSTTPAATNSSSSTAPGVTPGAGPQAPASQGNALDVFNQEIQVLWDDVRPFVLDQIGKLAATQLQGQKYSNKALDLEVVNVRMGPQTRVDVAPGLTRLDTGGLTLRAPLTGSWVVALEADARIRVKIGSFQPAINVPLTLVLEDLTAEIEVALDDSDVTRPVISRVGTPQIQFRLRIDSSSSIVQNLTGLLNAPASWLAQRAVTTGLNSLLPNLQSLNGIPGPVPAAGAAPLQDNGVQTPFEEIARNVALKIRQQNQPHGTVLIAKMDTPQPNSTWLDAYSNGGAGSLGTPIDYPHGGDSAIWTGSFLAGEAFRWAMTGDSLAMDQIGYTLSGIEALLDVNGATGLLARVVAPLNSVTGNRIAQSGAFRTTQYRGETWVSSQGRKGISRDQYTGVFLGLSVAYELVPAVRAQCELRIKQMLDYFIANDWIIDEDRPVWNGTNGSRGPTFWVGVGYQKLTYLLMGHRMDPARYATALAQAGPLAETAWLGQWANTLGIDHYYKFNLLHNMLYSYFRLETDSTRWQQMHRAYAITERYVGHHQNPYFDLIQTSIDPQSRVDLFPASRQALRRFLEQNHREVGPAVVDLSGYTFVPLTQFGYSNTSGGGASLGTSTRQISTIPLDIRIRTPSTHFLWQRDPFTPVVANAGDPSSERMGLDYTLPYWMGRYLGAF